MQDCFKGVIALCPTGNLQGEFYFMSITTGRRLNLQQFTPLPLPQEVINRVHWLAFRNPIGLDVRYQYHRPYIDVANDYDYDESN